MPGASRTPLAVTSINAIISHPAVPTKKPSAHKKPYSFVPTSNSLKRKADEEIDQDDNDDEPQRYQMLHNCDQIRLKINNFIGSGEMKVGEFCKAIGVTNKSLNSFLNQNGPSKGMQSNTFLYASIFFQKREARGIKTAVKKVKKSEGKNVDVSDIHLDGEEDMEVEVYDTCHEVRKKIRAHLREPGVTQAGFLREIVKTYPEEKKIQSKVMNDFLGKKGAHAGNTSSVYYASYVFFEKLRIRDNKPKSKHRLDMEDLYPDGVDVKRRRDNRYIVPVGVNVYEDKYGMVSCF